MRLISFSGSDPATKIASMAIAAVFLCLIALQCYVFWENWQAGSMPLAAVKPSQTSVQNRPDIGRLAASHLFGDVESTTPQYNEVKEDRSLNLTLRGIVANSAGKSSLAIIESGPNNEETFAIGDNVFNKGKLDFVAADHVILARSNGQLARLQLPEQDSSGVISEEYLPAAQPDYVEPVEPILENHADIPPEIAPEPLPVVQPVEFFAEPAPEELSVEPQDQAPDQEAPPPE